MVLETIIEELEKAREAAKLTTASFGFPNDRIEIKSVHFGDDDKGRVGDVLHPDEYIKKIVRLHHASWVVGPINRAIELLENNADVLRDCEKLLRSISAADVESLADRARAGLRVRE